MGIIAERLKQLREKQGLNKKQLASAVGIPYGTYNHFEIGDREPNSMYLKMFAEYFSVSIDYIMGYSSLEIQQRNIIVFDNGEIRHLPDFPVETQESIINYIDFLESQHNKDK